MAKSTKIIVTSRVNDVLRLILAGAEFTDIRQFGSQHSWNVSDRQIRRYIERAHKQFARATRRDRQQLLGRHLMQRRAIYARAIRADDLKTALQVLRDEAALEGLYPGSGQSWEQTANSGPAALSRKERVVRLIRATANKDQTDKALMEQVTPRFLVAQADTTLPVQMLHTMALMYVCEQLEYAAMLVNAMFSASIGGDEDAGWDFAASVAAYRFRIGRQGWERFCESLDLDAQYLIASNYQGSFLQAYEDKICDLAPELEQLQTHTAKPAGDADDPMTAETLANSWHRLFDRVSRDFR